MTPQEYANLDGLGLANMVRRQEVKPSELVEIAIALAEKHNPALNAIVFKAYEQAREEAEACSTGGSYKGPFQGVPFLIKDLGAEREGWPTTHGTRLAPDVPAPYSETIISRFLNAGVIPIGKTAAPEFGLLPTTESARHGITRNPWNTNHTPGGSSGGSAAAVAAGITPIAHANDGGGSIRIPANCCGLVGMKPTRGRTPDGPMLGELAAGLGIHHIVSRSVRDSAAMLDAVAGPEPGDLYYAPPQNQSYLNASLVPPRPMRIAYWARDWTQSENALHPDCEASVMHAVSLLEALGHQVEEARPTIDQDQILEGMTRIFACLAETSVAALCDALGVTPSQEQFEPATWAYYEAAQSMTPADYIRTQTSLHAAAREAGRFHETYDVLITPVHSTPPIKTGVIGPDAASVEAHTEALNGYMGITYLQNVTGQPSLSLPLYQTAEGLPVGVMFTAANGGEDLLYGLAGQLEHADPWIHRKPPIWA